MLTESELNMQKHRENKREKEKRALLKEEYNILLSDEARKDISLDDYIKLDKAGLDATHYWRPAKKGVKVEDFIKAEEVYIIIDNENCETYEMHKEEVAWVEDNKKLLQENIKEKSMLKNIEKFKDEWKKLGQNKLKIEYENSALQRAIEDVRYAKKKLGAATTNALNKRIKEMKRYSNVCEYLNSSKGNPKPLINDMKGIYSTRINNSVRLVWRIKQNGRNDTIVLKQISEYHNKKDNVRI